MFAQFRAQYPQGSVTTEMLAKIDGLHVFRATIKHGDIILGTGTATDPDIEVAEERAVKRALMLAGISFDRSFDDSYGMQATLMPQQSHRPMAMNASHQAPLPQKHADTLQLTAQSLRSLEQLDITALNPDSKNYADYEHPPQDDHGETLDHDIYQPSDVEASPKPRKQEKVAKVTQPDSPEPPKPSPFPTGTDFGAEPVDMSDAIAQTSVEMERLAWDAVQGRNYLQKTFGKRSRQQLTDTEMLQFLSHLKTLPTPEPDTF